MRRWKAWIAGALALAGLATVSGGAQARSMAAPELMPLHAATPVTGTATAAVAPTCQYGYYRHGWRGRHGYGRPYGWHRRYGYRRHYGYRRPYGFRRPYGYRRHYGYRPIGFYGRPHYGYGRPYGYGYRQYGW